jgi:hypothetical protein
MVQTVMKTLLNEHFAPITTSIGYVRAGLDDVARTLVAWRGSLGRQVQVSSLSGSLPEFLPFLEPLTGGARPRELAVEMEGRWTAYFDCSIRGTDAVSAVGSLTRKLDCEGVAVRTTPHTFGCAGVDRGRFGSVQFEMFGPQNDGHFLNYVRSIAVAFTGRTWVFTANGTEQPFEAINRYSTPRVRDRFTSEMLEEYCRAVGIDVFNEAAYGPRATLIESDEPVPADGLILTLPETQRWLEIKPEVAEALPG